MDFKIRYPVGDRYVRANITVGPDQTFSQVEGQIDSALSGAPTQVLMAAKRAVEAYLSLGNYAQFEDIRDSLSSPVWGTVVVHE